jgi:hypothetical protein
MTEEQITRRDRVQIEYATSKENSFSASVKALLQAAQEFFQRYNQCPRRLRSIIGSHAAKLS